MSCWCRTTVLRIPAVRLGFGTIGQWREFMKTYGERMTADAGGFAGSICCDYAEWVQGRGMYFDPADPETPLLEEDPYDPGTIPGPFLDYYLEQIEPLRPEDNTYHMSDIARPLTAAEKKKYLPLYRKVFPDFTLEDMEHVHYCRYEWYNGAEPDYRY
ncbi:MAG: hypothetical protein K6G61_07885 [Solobacterium sp.]|nr:hypothetical protein [Solobacterium sp.]